MIPTAIELIVIQIWRDIHSPQRMKPNDFGDPLTFSLVPPADQLPLIK